MYEGRVHSCQKVACQPGHEGSMPARLKVQERHTKVVDDANTLPPFAFMLSVVTTPTCVLSPTDCQASSSNAVHLTRWPVVLCHVACSIAAAAAVTIMVFAHGGGSKPTLRWQQMGWCWGRGIVGPDWVQR